MLIGAKSRVKYGEPGVVERIKQALVTPWVAGGVKTVFGEGVGADLADERKGAVEVGVPRNRTDRNDGCRSDGSARGKERLFSKE